MATTILRERARPYGPRDAGVPLTPDEFEAAEFKEGYRYELINGVLVVSPAPLEEERDANEELGRWLRNHAEFHPEGKVLNLTLHEQMVRTRRNVRRVDRAIWAGLGRRPVTRGPVARRDFPTICVEFPSSRPADQRRDYKEKRIEYRDSGEQEYWIIDRFRRTMTVYRWRGRRWVKETLSEADTYRSPLLPGFELSLAKIFALTDAYRR